MRHSDPPTNPPWNEVQPTTSSKIQDIATTSDSKRRCNKLPDELGRSACELGAPPCELVVVGRGAAALVALSDEIADVVVDDDLDLLVELGVGADDEVGRRRLVEAEERSFLLEANPSRRQSRS